MNRTLAALALTPFLVPADDRAEFAPAAESSVTKTFTARADIGLEDVIVQIGDQEIDPSMMGSPSIEIGLEYRLVVTDVYGESVDGHPTVERTFDELYAETTVEGDIVEGGGDASEATSELEGETVVFTWNEESESYEASSDTVDDDVLEGLRFDMDYTYLLPEGGAVTDDTWEVSGFGQDLVMPGGDLALESEDSEDDDELDEETLERLKDAASEFLEAALEATYRGTTEEGSAEIGLAMDLDATIDLTELAAEALESSIQADAEMPEFTTVEVELEAEPRGTLLWNLEEDVFDRFDLEAVGYISVELEASIPGVGDGSASIELSVDLSLSAETDA